MWWTSVSRLLSTEQISDREELQVLELADGVVPLGNFLANTVKASYENITACKHAQSNFLMF